MKTQSLLALAIITGLLAGGLNVNGETICGCRGCLARFPASRTGVAPDQYVGVIPYRKVFNFCGICSKNAQ